MDLFIGSLQTLNQILTAGVAVTGLSLLLYALTFNLRDRVARSFAAILGCVTIVFAGEALTSVAVAPAEFEFWLRFQWIGIVMLPAAYFHASDALLATTGQPSRPAAVIGAAGLPGLAGLPGRPTAGLAGRAGGGRRRAGALPDPHAADLDLHHLLHRPDLLGMGQLRAGFPAHVHQHRPAAADLPDGRRNRPGARFVPLPAAAAPARLRYPAAVLGIGDRQQPAGDSAAGGDGVRHGLFGVAWPDRVVRSRLFRWLLRGPVTATTVLAVTTLVRRAGDFYGLPYTAAVPISMVATILVMQLLITLSAPYWERLLLRSGDYGDVRAIQELENRLLTTNDLRQFLEAVLAAVCDRLQSPAAFVAGLGPEGLDLVVTVGERERMRDPLISEDLLKVVGENGHDQDLFTWGPYWLIPLFNGFDENRQLMGLLGVLREGELALDEEQHEALAVLAERASLALRDRFLQRQIFSSLQELAPNVDMIQRLRAASRYDGAGVLSQTDLELEQDEVTQWTRDALSHYWGGPKLTESPLMRLKIVQSAIESGENLTNALRATLKKAIEQVRPEGERRFTAEWILYNILEMKFMEGRKVREIAMRLAMSEADFYRKQRIAIEEVAKVVVDMEQLAVMEEQAVPLESHPTKPEEV